MIVLGSSINCPIASEVKITAAPIHCGLVPRCTQVRWWVNWPRTMKLDLHGTAVKNVHFNPMQPPRMQQHKEQCHDTIFNAVEQSAMPWHKVQHHSISWHKEQCHNATMPQNKVQHCSTKSIATTSLATKSNTAASLGMKKMYGTTCNAATNAASTSNTAWHTMPNGNGNGDGNCNAKPLLYRLIVSPSQSDNIKQDFLFAFVTIFPCLGESLECLHSVPGLLAPARLLKGLMSPLPTVVEAVWSFLASTYFC